MLFTDGDVTSVAVVTSGGGVLELLFISDLTFTSGVVAISSTWVVGIPSLVIWV